MVTSTVKELQKSDIRTMRKDLKRVQEGNVVKEKVIIPKTPLDLKKVIAPIAPIKVPATQKITEIPVKKLVVAPIQTAITEKKPESILPPIPATTEKVTGGEHTEMMEIKKYANEAERQKMSLLEREREELEKNLWDVVEKEQNPLEKQGLSEQKKLQEELRPLIIESDRLKRELQSTEEKQKTGPSAETITLQDRVKDLQVQQERIQKKKLQVEKDILLVQEKNDILHKSHTGERNQADELNLRIAEIDQAINQMYATVMERKNQPPEAIKKPVSFASSGAPIQTKPIMQSSIAHIKEMPIQVKEKIAKTVVSEEERRRKFMEDIEAWASSENK